MPNASFNGTMIVFSNFYTPPMLQFYCCLGLEYSEIIPVGGVVRLQRTVSMTPSLTVNQSTVTASRQVHTATQSSRTRTVRPTPSCSVSVSRRHVRTQTYSVSEITGSQRHTRSRVLPLPAPPSAVLVNQSAVDPVVVTMRSAAFVGQIAGSTAVALSLGAGTAGMATARAMGVLSISRHCYELLLNLQPVNVTAASGSTPLPFPESAWPGLQVGDDEHSYARGAAVAGTVAIAVTTVLAFVVGIVLL